MATHGRRPAYHGTSHAIGGSPWQRFWLVFGPSAFRRFAADCHRCNHGVPLRLHPLLSALASVTLGQANGTGGNLVGGERKNSPPPHRRFVARNHEPL